MRCLSVSMRTQLLCFNLSSAVWNAETLRKFLHGMHTPKGLLYKFCPFFLFEQLWKITPPPLSSPTTENLRMYRMMSDTNSQMKAYSWSWRQLFTRHILIQHCESNMCNPSLFPHCKHILLLIFFYYLYVRCFNATHSQCNYLFLMVWALHHPARSS